MRPSRRRDLRVVVVGAGAFGGWTALALQYLGASVTLVDAWGPGNPLASSGDETRVMRSMYGRDEVYVGLVARARDIWRARQREWGRLLYHQCGVLWIFSGDDEYARASIPLLTAAGVRVDEIPVPTAANRYPQIDFRDVRSVYYEHEAGILHAAEACRAVCDAVQAGGGTYHESRVQPGPIEGGTMRTVSSAADGAIEADVYVFACGSWLGAVLPDVLGDVIVPTKQEIYYFAPVAERYALPELPVWIDFGDRIRYGVPDRGSLKVADDTRGVRFDPSERERVTTDEGIAAIRSFLSHRFPGLARASILEARVCPYENSPDGHLIVDRHPGADNVWIVGGGSGHGFKLGPALGEHVADCIVRGRTPAPEFSLRRLNTRQPRATQFETGLRGREH